MDGSPHVPPTVPPDRTVPGNTEKLAQRQQSWAHWLSQHIRSRKVKVLIFGTTSILAGTVMLVTPGPGIITILMGLMALGTEFAWARWLVSWAPKILRDVAQKALDLSFGELQRPLDQSSPAAASATNDTPATPDVCAETLTDAATLTEIVPTLVPTDAASGTVPQTA